jgi:hypothetical protein
MMINLVVAVAVSLVTPGPSAAAIEVGLPPTAEAVPAPAHTPAGGGADGT